MSKIEGLVEIPSVQALILAEQTICRIKEERTKRFEGQVEYNLKQPVKQNLWDKFLRRELPKRTREDVIEDFKLQKSVGYSLYEHFHSFWSELENECHLIVLASQAQGVEKIYIPTKTVAYMYEFTK